MMSGSTARAVLAADAGKSKRTLRFLLIEAVERRIAADLLHVQQHFAHGGIGRLVEHVLFRGERLAVGSDGLHVVVDAAVHMWMRLVVRVWLPVGMRVIVRVVVTVTVTVTVTVRPVFPCVRLRRILRGCMISGRSFCAGVRAVLLHDAAPFHSDGIIHTCLVCNKSYNMLDYMSIANFVWNQMESLRGDERGSIRIGVHERL